MSDDLTDEEGAELAALSKSRLPRRGLAYEAPQGPAVDPDQEAAEMQLLRFVRDRDWDSVIAAATALRKRGGG